MGTQPIQPGAVHQLRWRDIAQEMQRMRPIGEIAALGARFARFQISLVFAMHLFHMGLHPAKKVRGVVRQPVCL